MTAARFLGRYELGERIGLGGVAEVMRATASGARGFSKTVVVKRVRAELRENVEVVEAFVREAELARRFVHGNVAQVLDLGTDDDGVPYLVLEYVDGCSLFELRERLAAAGDTMPVGVAVHIVEQIGLALQYVHGLADDDGVPLGLVHRDVTPKNILVSRDGVVKLTDFGIARATSGGSDTLPGFIKGTPQYLSPEQAAGRHVDERTDVYSLGLVLRTLLPTDADAELVAIVDAATEPAVRDRLPSAAALVARLQSWRVGHGIDIDPDRLATLVRKTSGARAGVRSIALDHALRADAGAAPTRQIAPAQGAPRSRWPWLVLGVAALAIGTTFAIATMPAPSTAEDPSVARAEPARPVAPRDAPPAAVPSTIAEPPATEAPVATPPPEPAPKRARKPGRLRVNVLPYAQVTIDGEDWGRTPIDRELEAGEHTLELYNPDSQQRVKKPVRIVAGKPSSIETW